MYPRTADEALARLQQGAKLRCTSATVNNADSSRSHAVFVLELAIRTPCADGSWVEANPRLVMMDLAGGSGFGKPREHSQGLLKLGVGAEGSWVEANPRCHDGPCWKGVGEPREQS